MTLECITDVWERVEQNPGLQQSFQACLYSTGVPCIQAFVRPRQWDSVEISQWLCFPTKTEQDSRKFFFLAMCNLTRTVCSYSVEYSKFPDAIALKQELLLSCVCSVLLTHGCRWRQLQDCSLSLPSLGNPAEQSHLGPVTSARIAFVSKTREESPQCWCCSH